MLQQQCYYCKSPVRLNDEYCPNCNQQLYLQGRYRIEKMLGKGGFAVVFEAVDTRINRRYAIKVVSSSTRAEQQMVEKEANILSQFASRFAFIPDVYDLWTERDKTFLVMELIEGPTLDQLLGSPWSGDRVFDFIHALLDMLIDLHGSGIVHRDIKPENIKCTPEGHYVLLDFGIAKHGGATMISAKAGSVEYASPEQIRGMTTDDRSDLYSLGATAYHLLTGHPPTPVLNRLAHSLPVPSPRQFYRNIPVALETMILRLLEIDPSARPQTAQAALALLTSVSLQPQALQVQQSNLQFDYRTEHMT